MFWGISCIPRCSPGYSLQDLIGQFHAYLPCKCGQFIYTLALFCFFLLLISKAFPDALDSFVQFVYALFSSMVILSLNIICGMYIRYYSEFTVSKTRKIDARDASTAAAIRREGYGAIGIVVIDIPRRGIIKNTARKRAGTD